MKGELEIGENGEQFFVINSSKNLIFKKFDLYRDLLEIFYLYRVTFLWKTICGKIDNL